MLLLCVVQLLWSLLALTSEVRRSRRFTLAAGLARADFALVEVIRGGTAGWLRRYAILVSVSAHGLVN